MASEADSEQKNGPEWKEGEKKKKSDANVNRKFGIMKWSQSPGKRREAIILWVGGEEKLFSPQALEKMFF